MDTGLIKLLIIVTFSISTEGQFNQVSTCVGQPLTISCSDTELIYPIYAVGGSNRMSECPFQFTDFENDTRYQNCCGVEHIMEGYICSSEYQTRVETDGFKFHKACIGQHSCTVTPESVQAASWCDLSIVYNYTNVFGMHFRCLPESQQIIMHENSNVSGSVAYLLGQDYQLNVGIPASATNVACSVQTTNGEGQLEVELGDLRLQSPDDCKQSIRISDGETELEISCENVTFLPRYLNYTSDGSYITVNLTNNLGVTGGFFWLGIVPVGTDSLSVHCPAIDRGNFTTTSTQTTETSTVQTSGDSTTQTDDGNTTQTTDGSTVQTTNDSTVQTTDASITQTTNYIFASTTGGYTSPKEGMAKGNEESQGVDIIKIVMIVVAILLAILFITGLSCLLYHKCIRKNRVQPNPKYPSLPNQAVSNGHPPIATSVSVVNEQERDETTSTALLNIEIQSQKGSEMNGINQSLIGTERQASCSNGAMRENQESEYTDGKKEEKKRQKKKKNKKKKMSENDLERNENENPGLQEHEKENSVDFPGETQVLVIQAANEEIKKQKKKKKKDKKQKREDIEKDANQNQESRERENETSYDFPFGSQTPAMQAEGGENIKRKKKKRKSKKRKNKDLDDNVEKSIEEREAGV